MQLIKLFNQQLAFAKSQNFSEASLRLLEISQASQLDRFTFAHSKLIDFSSQQVSKTASLHLLLLLF